MGVGLSPRRTQPRTLIRSLFADAGMRRPDYEATIGRAILPVRAADRGWQRDSGTTWKWLDMTEEERETAFARIGLACSGRGWHGNQCQFLRKLLKIILFYFKRLIVQNSIAF